MHRPVPFTPNTGQTPAKANDAYFAALAPVFAPMFSGVVVLGLSLLARVCGAFEDSVRYNCDHNTKKFKVAMLAMILFMIALKGTREEKTEFLNRMFEKLYTGRRAQMTKLRAAYIKWRQRKCWMWAGGLRGAALSRVTDVFAGGMIARRDDGSFDALIPN